MIPARLIGVIEARQSERDDDDKATDNHRLVAVPTKCKVYADCKSLKHLNGDRLHEIEQFFISYTARAASVSRSPISAAGAAPSASRRKESSATTGERRLGGTRNDHLSGYRGGVDRFGARTWLRRASLPASVP